MRVPGHGRKCLCKHCQDKCRYILLPDGRYTNFTEHLKNGEPFKNAPARRAPETPISSTPIEKPCPPVEYRRGKPVVPKGRKYRN